jgi:hypothetical protein
MTTNWYLLFIQTNIGLGMKAFLLLGSLLVSLNAVEGNTEIVNFQATEGLGVDLEFTNAW